VSLGYHVGPSILVLARDWLVFCSLDPERVLPAFLLNFQHSNIFQGTYGFGIYLDKYAGMKC
jgi:hypothetical protein